MYATEIPFKSSACLAFLTILIGCGQQSNVKNQHSLGINQIGDGASGEIQGPSVATGATGDQGSGEFERAQPPAHVAGVNLTFDCVPPRGEQDLEGLSSFLLKCVVSADDHALFVRYKLLLNDAFVVTRSGRVQVAAVFGDETVNSVKLDIDIPVQTLIQMTRVVAEVGFLERSTEQKSEFMRELEYLLPTNLSDKLAQKLIQ